MGRASRPPRPPARALGTLYLYLFAPLALLADLERRGDLFRARYPLVSRLLREDERDRVPAGIGHQQVLDDARAFAPAVGALQREPPAVVPAEGHLFVLDQFVVRKRAQPLTDHVDPVFHFRLRVHAAL